MGHPLFLNPQELVPQMAEPFERRLFDKMFTKAGYLLLLLVACLSAKLLLAQTAQRPPITGVSHFAIFAHDYEKSRAFYSQFLGFEEPYSLKNADGSASMTFFKINDRQVIELFPERRQAPTG
jgi:hypothetical protein